MNYAESIDELFEQIVSDHAAAPEQDVPDHSSPVTLGEALEMLAILHIRNWNLEDQAGEAQTDEEWAGIKRKLEFIFKIKRPRLLAAINMMLGQVLTGNTAAVDDMNVKRYRGFNG